MKRSGRAYSESVEKRLFGDHGGDIIDRMASIMRERNSNSSTTARAVAASGGWLRQCLTSNASRASLRRANNDGICVRHCEERSDEAIHAPLGLLHFVRNDGSPISPLFDPRRRRRVDCRGRPSSRPLRRPRRAGRVKSAAIYRAVELHQSFSVHKYVQ